MENNYKEYLDSFAWKAIKQVKLSEQPECECCGEKASTVHHLSYERRGSEKEEDIVSICERCHHECHFVNGYQIKNDEDILRKRFEEVRDEFGGNLKVFEYEKLNNYKYKYENKTGNIYINGIKSKLICSFNLDYYSENISYSIFYNGEGLFYVSEYSGDEISDYNEKFTNISKKLIFTQNNKSNYFKYSIIKLYKIELIKIFNIKTFENKEYIGLLDKIYYQGELLERIDINTFKIIADNCSLDKNHVYFYSRILEGADSESFESLNEGYFKDKNHVYYNSTVIERADSKSFFILKDNYEKTGYIYYCKDKNYVFYDGKIIEGADPESFEVINNDFIKDKNYVYNYNGELIKGLDPKSFVVINKKFYKDKDGVYYNSKIIEGVIPDGFEILVPGLYYKDKKHVFYKGQIIEGCDSKSFEFINNEYSCSDDYNHSNYYNNRVVHNYSKDKNNVFYNGIIIKLLNPNSFKILVEGLYTKDCNNVFYKGNIIDGADPKTFTELNENYYTDKQFVFYNGEKVKFKTLFSIKYADPKTFKVTGLYTGVDINTKYLGADKFK